MPFQLKIAILEYTIFQSMKLKQKNGRRTNSLEPLDASPADVS